MWNSLRCAAGIIVAGFLATASAENLTSVNSFREEVYSANSTATSFKPTGKLTLQKRGTTQRFTAQVDNLVGVNFGVYIGSSSGHVSNDLVYLVAAMDKTDDVRLTWKLQYQANGTAPAQLTTSALEVADLTDLEGRVLYIGYPSGEIKVDEDGNTNTIVKTVLWAPVSELVTSPGKTSFKAKAKLLPPDEAPPTPKAKGSVQLLYNGARGSSRLDIRVAGLPRGNEYTLYLEDETTQHGYREIEKLTPGANSATGTYIRDTGLGDTLPLEAAYASDLAGKAILILDANGAIQLLGAIPDVP